MRYRGRTLSDIQEARPQARSGFQSIQRESWRPLIQPAHIGHRKRKRQMWMRPTERDLEVFEEYVGRRFLDKLNSRQHRLYDLYPESFANEFASYLNNLQPEIRAAIERVIA